MPHNSPWETAKCYRSCFRKLSKDHQCYYNDSEILSLQGKDPDTSNSAAYVSRDIRPAVICNIRSTDACATVAYAAVRWSVPACKMRSVAAADSVEKVDIYACSAVLSAYVTLLTAAYSEFQFRGGVNLSWIFWRFFQSSQAKRCRLPRRQLLSKHHRMPLVGMFQTYVTQCICVCLLSLGAQTGSALPGMHPWHITSALKWW